MAVLINVAELSSQKKNGYEGELQGPVRESEPYTYAALCTSRMKLCEDIRKFERQIVKGRKSESDQTSAPNAYA